MGTKRKEFTTKTRHTCSIKLPPDDQYNPCRLDQSPATTIQHEHISKVVPGVLWRATFRPHTTKQNKDISLHVTTSYIAALDFLNLPTAVGCAPPPADSKAYNSFYAKLTRFQSRQSRQQQDTTLGKTASQSAKLLCDKFFAIHPP